MPVEEGIQMYSRKVYNNELISNVFPNFPLGQLLLKENADRNRMGRDIGLPDVPEVISGNGRLTESQLIQLATAQSYFQDFHTGYTDDSKVIGERDTEAKVANPLTDSADQHYGNMEWRRVEIQTPVTVWKSQVNAAKAKAGADAGSRGRAVLDVFGNAIKEARAVHVTNLAKRLYAAKPSNQDLSKWDNPLGLYEICHASNVYARLNRAKEANKQMRGTRITTSMTASLKELVDYAKYTATLGNGQTGGLAALNRQDKLKVALTGSALFQIFRNEAEARGGGNLVNTSDTLKALGKFGFTGEACQYGNTLCVCDNNIAANYVAMGDLSSLTVAFEQGKKMALSKWKYLPDYASGAEQRYEATITSAFFFICHNPLDWILYTAVL